MRKGLLIVCLGLCGCGSSTPSSMDGGSSTEGVVTPEELARRGDCPAATGEGTKHSGFITVDETWTAAGNPHRVETNTRITATVTIEPCVTVLLGENTLLEVGSTTDAGRLIAKGEIVGSGSGRAVRSITFDAIDRAKPWGQIVVQPKGTADLAIAAVMNGGDVISGLDGAIATRGVAGGTNDGPVARVLGIDRVLVERSASHGVNLDGWATFTEGSRKLWIRSSGRDGASEAIRIEPGIASTLPIDLSLSGNKRDAILVQTSKAFMRDDTLVARGAPYRVAQTVYVGPTADGPPVTLKIEPGVTVEMEKDTFITVGISPERQGKRVAEGAADKPIVFTSA